MAVHGPTASATELARWVAEDPELRQEIARDPSALERLALRLARQATVGPTDS
jgi:hypothetical protein